MLKSKNVTESCNVHSLPEANARAYRNFRYFAMSQPSYYIWAIKNTAVIHAYATDLCAYFRGISFNVKGRESAGVFDLYSGFRVEFFTFIGDIFNDQLRRES